MTALNSICHNARAMSGERAKRIMTKWHRKTPMARTCSLPLYCFPKRPEGMSNRLTNVLASALQFKP